MLRCLYTIGLVHIPHHTRGVTGCFFFFLVIRTLKIYFLSIHELGGFVCLCCKIRRGSEIVQGLPFSVGLVSLSPPPLGSTRAAADGGMASSFFGGVRSWLL